MVAGDCSLVEVVVDLRLLFAFIQSKILLKIAFLMLRQWMIGSDGTDGSQGRFGFSQNKHIHESSWTFFFFSFFLYFFPSII